MAENSKIQWTTATFNPWRGCTRVSEGCKFCYAETLSNRNPAVLGQWGPNGTRVVASESMWRQPVKWNANAAQTGERFRVFCASLADVFEDYSTMPAAAHAPISAARHRLFELIDRTPHLDWLLLTKRPQNVGLFWPDRIRRRNVWLGCTAESQPRFEERLPQLLASRHLVPVLFLSVEPMLGAMDIRPALVRDGVDWVIIGGESGGEARPFDPFWARMLVDQCRDTSTAVFVKQMGSNPMRLTVRKKGGDLDDIPEDLRVREFPAGS